MFDKDFKKKLFQIALPVTLQSLMQSSLGLIDQIMIGRLGSQSIAGIGLAGKFTSIFSVTAAALVAAAGILIAQYMGAGKKEGARDSFYFPLYIALFLCAVFTSLSLLVPEKVLGLYSSDLETIKKGAAYLKWRALECLPAAAALFVSAVLRNLNMAALPAAAGAVSIVINTIFNWLLIFGKGIFPAMEERGAALATVISRFAEAAIVLFFFLREIKRRSLFFFPAVRFSRKFVKNALQVLSPILLGEFLWSLGENVYAVIYGRLGTEPCAAMALMYPIQGIAIGALSGLAAAAGIIVGNTLGADDQKKAYEQTLAFVRWALALGLAIGGAAALLSPLYARLFNVPPETRKITIKILLAFAAVFTAKVFNMVVGGGVLQAGGQTKMMTAVNIIGTWGFGVPLGFLSAYVFDLPIHWVYFILSLEEFVRLAISAFLLKSKRWMKNVAV